MGRGAFKNSEYVAQTRRAVALRDTFPLPREEDPQFGGKTQDDRLRAAIADMLARNARDPWRMRELQELCIAEIEMRHGPDMAIELPIPSLYGVDRWDAASARYDLPLLAISAKSLMASRNQAAANRLREMLGEAIGVRHGCPDAVLGYLCVIAIDQPGRRGGTTSRHSAESIAQAIGERCLRSENGPQHHFDAGCVLAVDSQTGDFRTMTAAGLLDYDRFIDCLVWTWRQRVAAQSKERPVRDLGRYRIAG